MSYQFTLVLTFTRDEQKDKCGGFCWQSISTNSDRQLLHKTNAYLGINARIGLFTNEFHRCSFGMYVGDFELELQQIWVNNYHSMFSGSNGPKEAQRPKRMGLGQALAPCLDIRSSRTAHTLKLGAVGTMGWPAGRPPWSADQACGPHCLNQPCGNVSLVHNVGSSCKSSIPPAEEGWHPPIYMRGGVQFQHTSPWSFTSSSSIWSLWFFILDAFGSLGVLESRERVGWSRGSAGLVATLLRLYLDGCLLIIVSVRDFLCYFRNTVLVQVLASYLLLDWVFA